MTAITADKISGHDMQGSIISFNCSWPESFCFGSRQISVCKLLFDSKGISVECLYARHNSAWQQGEWV